MDCLVEIVAAKPAAGSAATRNETNGTINNFRGGIWRESVATEHQRDEDSIPSWQSIFRDMGLLHSLPSLPCDIQSKIINTKVSDSVHVSGSDGESNLRKNEGNGEASVAIDSSSNRNLHSEHAGIDEVDSTALPYLQIYKPASVADQKSLASSLKSDLPAAGGKAPTQAQMQMQRQKSKAARNRYAQRVLDASPKTTAPLTDGILTKAEEKASMMVKHFPLPRASPARDLLIVFTTCNLLSMTVLALDYLGHSLDVADLVIVDDHSVDGTVEYLIKKGYFVLTKDTPAGLTDSWNKGYYLAVAMGYKYVVFANNDILVPKGAVRELRRVLMTEALVVPLTTYKGAGHNPSQVQISCNQKR
jgi:hypothetical protein